MSSQSSGDVASYEPVACILDGIFNHMILTTYNKEPKTYFYLGKGGFLNSATNNILVWLNLSFGRRGIVLFMVGCLASFLVFFH